MLHRFLIATIFCTSFLAMAACENAGEPTPAAPNVSIGDILDPIRDRISHEQVAFFGETAWSFDYSGRLFKTNNTAENWTRVVLPDNGHISTMQFEDGGRLGFVVSKNGKMMRTDDSGETWTTIDLAAQVRDSVNIEYGGYYEQLQFDATLTNGVWVDYCQIFQTSDGGKTWSRLADGLQDKGSEERCVADAVYNPQSKTWFASVEIVGRMLTSGDYLFRSNDSGSSWQEICSLDEVGMLLKSVPSCFNLGDSQEELKAAVAEFTADFWATETEEQESFLEQIDRGIFMSHSLVVPADSNGWYARVGLIKDSTNDRIWLMNGEQSAYTDNNGESWHIVSNAMPDNELLDFSLATNRGFAILHYEFLAVSEDIGSTWKLAGGDQRAIYDLHVLPEHDRVIVATDIGLSVVDANTFVWRDVPDITDVSEIVVNGPVVWVFTGDGKIHRSSDAASTWTTLPANLEEIDFNVETASCTAIHCLLEGYQSIAHLAADPFELTVSDLTGPVPDPDEDYIVETVLAADLNHAWIAMEDGSLYATFDGGASWEKRASFREELYEFRSAPDNSSFFAWGYSNRYLWSGDGKTFETRKLPGGKNTSINSLCWLNESTALLSAYDEREDEDLYLATLDGGASWGALEPIYFSDNCRVRGELIVLDSTIAKVK